MSMDEKIDTLEKKLIQSMEKMNKGVDDLRVELATLKDTAPRMIVVCDKLENVSGILDAKAKEYEEKLKGVEKVQEQLDLEAADLKDKKEKQLIELVNINDLTKKHEKAQREFLPMLEEWKQGKKDIDDGLAKITKEREDMKKKSEEFKQEKEDIAQKSETLLKEQEDLKKQTESLEIEKTEIKLKSDALQKEKEYVRERSDKLDNTLKDIINAKIFTAYDRLEYIFKNMEEMKEKVSDSDAKEKTTSAAPTKEGSAIKEETLYDVFTNVASGKRVIPRKPPSSDNIE